MLEVRDIAVSYGRHRALDRISVAVGKGEVCVILGANGAGKSTLLKTIAGMVHADPGGEIVMNGKRITALKPHRIVEQGIALVPEGRGIFGDLSVAENLQLGAFASRARRDEAATLDLVYKLFPRLAERRRQVARTMSGGEQQMVAIGRALMSRPDILMLDEPSLGLSPLLTKELFRSLQDVAATGVGILLVEQNAKQSLNIADRGYLIENGLVVGEDTARALMSDPAVVHAYLGGAGAHGSARKIALPPPMRLPFDVGSMRGFMGDLADRAGRIQSAFVRATRQGGDLPSAFVGRYDPKSAADPWSEFGDAPMHLSGAATRVSADARRLGTGAEQLARRATERLARHVSSERNSAQRPAAFASAMRSATGWTRDKASRPQPAILSGDRQKANGARGLIGHNSAGFDIGAELDLPETTPAGRILSIGDLAARAAAIQAAHVAVRRKALTAFVIPAEASGDPAKKKRNKSKESAKKKRKKRKEA
ncbi:MAG: ABC transporter ATP-binding protein [Rhizobiaceae bacterium]